MSNDWWVMKLMIYSTLNIRVQLLEPKITCPTLHDQFDRFFGTTANNDGRDMMVALEISSLAYASKYYRT
jgi:hypothetical protein